MTNAIAAALRPRTTRTADALRADPAAQAFLLLQITFTVAPIAFGLDKRAARLGRWRVPEASLHFIELLGGFPGTLIGQRVFRHKRRKRRYLFILWLIIAVHAAVWLLWLLLRLSK